MFEVPNVPSEPDERIDKMTGLPYDQQAGTAFVDEEDPLRRLGFGLGSIVARAATKIPLEELATRGSIMPTRPIKDIIPDDTLNGLTRLVLTSAIYFKGDWLS